MQPTAPGTPPISEHTDRRRSDPLCTWTLVKALLVWRAVLRQVRENRRLEQEEEQEELERAMLRVNIDALVRRHVARQEERDREEQQLLEWGFWEHVEAGEVWFIDGGPPDAY